MNDLILLCHGRTREFSAFQLGSGQILQYRGNFGAPIDEDAARRVILTLLQDPMVSDQELQREIPTYIASAPLVGAGTYAPDIDLAGGDDPPCYLIDLSTRRRLRLGAAWSMRLSRVVEALPSPCYLNLICCTDAGIGVIEPAVKELVAVKSWEHVFREGR